MIRQTLQTYSPYFKDLTITFLPFLSEVNEFFCLFVPNKSGKMFVSDFLCLRHVEKTIPSCIPQHRYFFQK